MHTTQNNLQIKCKRSEYFFREIILYPIESINFLEFLINYQNDVFSIFQSIIQLWINSK